MSPRTFLVAAAALAAPALASSASAQTSFGLRAGLNVSDLTGDNIDGSSPRLGFTGGGFVNVPITPSLSFQPEVIYSQKGVSTDSDQTDLNADYVEVPILLKYAVPVTETGLMLGGYVGPALAFRVKENSSANFANVPGLPTGDRDVFKSTDIGAAFGLTVGAGPFAVDGRYTLGLQSATDDSETSLDLRHGVFSVAGTYTFGR